jgi:nucleoside-diphosphate-sugar epimerase
MKVLYIGGTGEVSYCCVAESARAGHEVTVFNRGHIDEPLPHGVCRITGDIEDRRAYAQLGERRFDVVCQFLGYEMSTVRRDVDVFGGKCDQYVFISTASAYEKPPVKHILTEDTPLRNPFWDYSQTKADMEAYLLQQHRAGRLNVTVVRPSHTVRRRFPGGIVRGDDWAWRLLNGRPLLIHGDGTALWTLTHSSDFAVPFVGLLGNVAARGEAFHITRHMEAYSWNEIFAEMARALGAEPNFVFVPTETLVRYDPAWAGPLWGDKAHSVLFDNTKVMQAAGEFQCRIGLPQIMRQAAKHYQTRAAGYQPNDELHALLDRIAADIRSLGGG